MRTITLIVIHCSAVRPGQRSSAEDIDKWHKDRVGYHYVIRRDGSIEKGRDITEVGAHCYPHNSHSIGICYEGGLNEKGEAADTRTPEQKKTLRELVGKLHRQFQRPLS